MVLRIVSTSLLLSGLLVGCGGGGNSAPVTTPSTGGLRFSIAWPTTQQSPTIHRLIPFNTQTIRISVTDPASPSTNLADPVTVTRSGDPVQQVVIRDIRPGAVRVGAQALDAQNIELAAGTVDATVALGLNTDVSLSLFPSAPNIPPL